MTQMKPSQQNPYEAPRRAECRKEDPTNVLTPRPKWQYAFVGLPMLVSAVLWADLVIASFQNDQLRTITKQTPAMFSILISCGAYFVFPIGLKRFRRFLNQNTTD